MGVAAAAVAAGVGSGGSSITTQRGRQERGAEIYPVTSPLQQYARCKRGSET